MMTSVGPLLSYMIDHRLEEQPDAEDLTINVETEIIRAGQESDSKNSSFSFTSHELFNEDKSLNYEKLYYFLIEAGIEEDNDAEVILNDMISTVSDLPFLKNNNELRGVLTVLLNILYPSNDPIPSDEPVDR
ncbi:unnamed protein product [Microthlaspi erraticum]|uniref:Uncharacterized protein n=1 Tax=Microthlaspi erraticum TaxID=1685480 RepID=A0A6D2I474_9BRAS|nr:unnamed protein product [Microthlaspi erraticum]